jgi:hypothetical protein
MDVLREYLPLLIPLLLIQLGLMAAGLWDLLHQQTTRGPRWVWALIIVFVNIIGPIIYFTVGREEAEVSVKDNTVLSSKTVLPSAARTWASSMAMSLALSRPRPGHSQPGRPLASSGATALGRRRRYVCMTGLASPTTGSAWVAGVETTRADSSARRVFGYLPQAPTFYGWMTAGRVSRLCGESLCHGEARTARARGRDAGASSALKTRRDAASVASPAAWCSAWASPRRSFIARPFSSWTSRPAHSIPQGATQCSI